MQKHLEFLAFTLICSVLIAGCWTPSDSNSIHEPALTTTDEQGTSVESSSTTSGSPEIQLPEKIEFNQFEMPRELTLYSLDFRETSSQREANSGRERFGDVLVIGKTEIKDFAKRQEVMTAIEDAKIYFGDLPKCFWPRHGLKIVDSKGITEMIICFECNQYSASGAHAIESYEGISQKPKALLNKILDEAGIERVPEDFFQKLEKEADRK